MGMLRSTARASAAVAAFVLAGITVAPAAAESAVSTIVVPVVHLVPAAGPGDTCISGFVWREARAADVVCVLPKDRDLTKQENAAADANRDPKGAHGPNSCKPGFVWREAFSGDVVCVTPDRRDRAKADNAKAGERRIGELKPPPELICKHDGAPTNGFSGNRYVGSPMRWSNRGDNNHQGSPGLGVQYDRCTKTVTVYFDPAAGSPTHYNLTVNGQHNEIKAGGNRLHSVQFPASRFGAGFAAFTLQSCERDWGVSDCSVRSPEIRVDVKP